MNRPIDSYHITWHDTLDFSAQSYTCPYCGCFIASDEGYLFEARVDDPEEYTLPDNRRGYICICPKCKNPTIIFEGRQFPSIPCVVSLKHLPEDISELYEETRRCMSNDCFTAVVMLCRKIIMNAAVSKGAKENGSFKSYVDFLNDNHLFHPLCIPMLDRIRTIGNDANHKIEKISHEDAKQIITFTYHVLLYIFELPNEFTVM